MGLGACIISGTHSHGEQLHVLNSARRNCDEFLVGSMKPSTKYYLTSWPASAPVPHHALEEPRTLRGCDGLHMIFPITIFPGEQDLYEVRVTGGKNKSSQRGVIRRRRLALGRDCPDTSGLIFIDPSDMSNPKKRSAETAPPPKKNKKRKTKSHPEDEALDTDLGLNTLFARMDNQLLADHLTQKTKRFGSDLSPVELSDLTVPGETPQRPFAGLGAHSLPSQRAVYRTRHPGRRTGPSSISPHSWRPSRRIPRA